MYSDGLLAFAILISATFDCGISIEYEVDMQSHNKECISLFDCPFYHEMVKEKVPNYIQILREVQCGFEDKTPKVLCPLKETHLEHTTLRNPTNSHNDINEISSCRTSLGNDGLCVKVEKCSLFTDLIKSIDRYILKYVLSLIQETNCGFDNYIPKVCCEISEHVENNPSVINFDQRFDGTTESKKIDTNLLNNNEMMKLNLLPKKCGIHKIGQTIKEETAHNLEFPWSASILYDTNVRKCGGSIIDHQHVLTSAQCVTDIENSVVIGIRIQNHDKDVECTLHNHPENCLPYKNMAISKIIIHPEFNISLLTNDIALVKLEENINFEKLSIYPICLPTSENSLENSIKNLIALNWTINETDLELDNISIPIIDEIVCEDFYKRVLNISIDHRQICTGNIGLKNLYKVDSGGPLQHLENINGDMAYVQYAISNFCLEKNALGIPGIHTRVSQYMEWILENLEKSLIADVFD